MSIYKILVVDDEEDLCEILRFNLAKEGHSVDVAHSAEDALLMNLESYELILLDVMMGEISGFKMASMLKKSEKLRRIPIIFLTARDAEEDLLHGFDVGAEDYISKPFSVKEVIARIRTIMRRMASAELPSEVTKLSFKGLEVDLTQKRCTVDNLEVSLTRKEFEILRTLMSKIGHVFSREELLTLVWTDEVFVLDRTIDVNITRLRKKISPYGMNIATRLGFGYCFDTNE